MRRMVGSAFAFGILRGKLVYARMDGCVLFSGAAFQLSALHGHGVPRVSYANGIREIPDFHGACGGAPGAGGRGCASLVSAVAVDLHAVHLLEPVALHGAKFWIADDVCAPRRPFAHDRRAPRPASLVCRFLCAVNVEFSHGNFRRRAGSFSRTPSKIHGTRARGSRDIFRGGERVVAGFPRTPEQPARRGCTDNAGRHTSFLVSAAGAYRSVERP